MELHIYETGFVSSKWTVEAPSAQSAAFYTMNNLAAGIGRLMTVVYTEDDKPFEGDSWWLELALKPTFTPDEEADLTAKLMSIKEELPFCKVIEAATS